MNFIGVRASHSGRLSGWVSAAASRLALGEREPQPARGPRLAPDKEQAEGGQRELRQAQAARVHLAHLGGVERPGQREQLGRVEKIVVVVEEIRRRQPRGFGIQGSSARAGRMKNAARPKPKMSAAAASPACRRRARRGWAGAASKPAASAPNKKGGDQMAPMLCASSASAVAAAAPSQPRRDGARASRKQASIPHGSRARPSTSGKAARQ